MPETMSFQPEEELHPKPAGAESTESDEDDADNDPESLSDANIEPLEDETIESAQPMESAALSEAAVNETAFIAEHPFGPEAASEKTIEHRREVAKGLLDRIRRHPLSQYVLRTMTVLAGVSNLLSSSIERSAETISSEITEELSDPGVQYEFRRLILEELRTKGELSNESEARYGREHWTQEEQLEYEAIPTLSGKFEYLHKANPDIIAAYRDPRGRLENFRVLFSVIGGEFKHTSLSFEFARQCSQDALTVLPTLPPEKAVAIYNEFIPVMLRAQGFREAHRLARGLESVLSKDHPVMERIAEDHLLSERAVEWLKPSKENSAYFNQVTGRMEMYHHAGENMLLLDAFPANGGSPDGVAWERGLPGHLAVRTPDGAFTFDRTLEKKSVNWQNSWVADTAPLRFAKDGKNVEYKDQDGTWRRLTGEDAEFVVYGAPEKPFKEKERSRLYQAATQRQSDGSVLNPQPFTMATVVDKMGNLRATWELNDFGPKSIRMTDQDGELMSVYFHSSPTDEGPEQFLDFSHGCVHMKPDDVEAAAAYLARGSSIRISSVDQSETTIARK